MTGEVVSAQPAVDVSRSPRRRSNADEPLHRFDPARVSCVLFDLDGTLADTDDAYVTSVAQRLPIADAGRRMRAARRLVMAAEGPGNIVFPILDRLGLDALVFRVAEVLRRGLSGAEPSAHSPVPGVPAMLALLKGRLPLAIVTNRRSEHAERFLEENRMTGYFSLVVGAAARTRGKPHPDMLMYAAKTLDVPIERCVMVGDTPVDMRAGRSAGAQTIGVLCGFGEEPELRRAGADLVLRSTAEVAGELGF